MWSRLVSHAITMVGGILLLCACATVGNPTSTPANVPPVERTAIPPPTPTIDLVLESLPSPGPTIEPKNEPGLDNPSTHSDNPTTADLAVQVSAPAAVVPGETAVYTVGVANHGPGMATDIVLSNTLPRGMAPVWTQPAQPLCQRQERSVHCDAGDLRSGDALTVALDLSVGGTETPLTGTDLAGVTVTLSAPTCTIDPDPAQPQVTCHLPNLPPGAGDQIRIGASTTGEIAELLVHTLTITGRQDDADPTNNHATFTMTVGTREPVSVTTVPTATDLVLHASGPASIIAGQPVTTTYTITNKGALKATRVFFEDAVPSDMNLVAYTPGLPRCQQQGDLLTCTLRDPDNDETLSFTLSITGSAGQPMILDLDPVAPGWPICTVVKENTWLHILQCQLGSLEPGQSTRVQMVLTAIGVRERTTANTATVRADEVELNPLDNTITTTAEVQIQADLVIRSEISGPAVAGQTVSYTLTVANQGPSDADDVVLTDALPTGTTLVSAVTSGGDECQIQENESSPKTITCDLGRLIGGEMANATVVLAVGESLTGANRAAFTHTARIRAKPVDPDPGNNELTEDIPISSRDQD